MNGIKVPLLDWLPGLSSLRAAEVLLYWTFAGIAACALSVTLLLCLRDWQTPVSQRRFLQRTLNGQVILLGIVLLFAALEIRWNTGSGMGLVSGTTVKVIWHSAACGLVLGWLFSAVAAAIHILWKKRGAQRGNAPDPGGCARRLALTFGLLFLLGLVNRYALLGPRLLSRGDFANKVTQTDAGVGVYRVNVSYFDGGGEQDVNLQRAGVFVYAEPDRHSGVIAELPTGTTYGMDDVTALTRPTTRLGWRYLPKAGGYAPTIHMLRAFLNCTELWRERVREIDPEYDWPRNFLHRAYISWNDARQIVDSDRYGFLTGQATTRDACFWMSPLSLLAWLGGLIAVPLTTARSSRRKRTELFGGQGSVAEANQKPGESK